MSAKFTLGPTSCATKHQWMKAVSSDGQISVPLYLLNVLLQIANKLGLHKKKNCSETGSSTSK
jgi:hypothetical protein